MFRKYRKFRVDEKVTFRKLKYCIKIRYRDSFEMISKRVKKRRKKTKNNKNTLNNIRVSN